MFKSVILIISLISISPLFAAEKKSEILVSHIELENVLLTTALKHTLSRVKTAAGVLLLSPSSAHADYTWEEVSSLTISSKHPEGKFFSFSPGSEDEKSPVFSGIYEEDTRLVNVLADYCKKVSLEYRQCGSVFFMGKSVPAPIPVKWQRDSLSIFENIKLADVKLPFYKEHVVKGKIPSELYEFAIEDGDKKLLEELKDRYEKRTIFEFYYFRKIEALCKESSPDNRTIHIALKTDVDVASLPVIFAKNISLAELIRAICVCSKLKYTVSSNTIIISTGAGSHSRY